MSSGTISSKIPVIEHDHVDSGEFSLAKLANWRKRGSFLERHDLYGAFAQESQFRCAWVLPA
jgi:hypothetical protein